MVPVLASGIRPSSNTARAGRTGLVIPENENCDAASLPVPPFSIREVQPRFGSIAQTLELGCMVRAYLLNSRLEFAVVIETRCQRRCAPTTKTNGPFLAVAIRPCALTDVPIVSEHVQPDTTRCTLRTALSRVLRLSNAGVDSIAQILQLLPDGLRKGAKLFVGELSRHHSFKAPGALDVSGDRRVVDNGLRQAAEPQN
jgi:hypothetical protein